MIITDTYAFIKDSHLSASYRATDPIFSMGGISLATEEEAHSFLPELTKHPDFDDETKAGYGTWVLEKRYGGALRTKAAFKFIRKFYWKPLFTGTGTKLTQTELEALLPYVDVTVEQMQEAQRRALRSAVVFAKQGVFNNEAEANAKGFILPAAFIDGGVEKSGFFIAQSLTSVTSDTIIFGEVWNGTPGEQLFRLASTCPSVQREFGVKLDDDGYSSLEYNGKDALNQPKHALSDKVQCESAYTVAAISLISLACAQYATSTDECAWYDPNNVTNFPKGINSTDKDINDSSVTIPTPMSSTTGSAFPTNQTAYCKTTHNGKIYGLAHVNGWLWHIFCGYGYVGGRYQLFDNSKYSITQITAVNCDSDTSMYNAVATPIGSAWSEESDTPLYVDLNGQGRQLNCLFSHSSGSNSNLFGSDYHDRDTYSAAFSCARRDDGTNAGVFSRSHNNWVANSSNWGFRAVGYPDL